MNLSTNEQVSVPEMTPEQLRVHDGILRFFRLSAKQKAVLLGFAGVGKTFVITRVLETLVAEDPWCGIAITATTNKALQVLMRDSKFETIFYGTAHQLLGLREKINQRTGELEYKRDTFRPAPVDQMKYILVDESSQLHSTVYGYFEEELKRRRDLKVLFIGDPFQIPPVQDLDSYGRPQDSIPMFKWKELDMDHFRLDTIVRQAADNPIIQYATAIRNGRPYKWPNVIPHKRDAMEELLKEQFCAADFASNADYAKVVVYRNKTSLYMNNWIRGLIFGYDVPQIVEGDKLVANDPVVEGDSVIIRNSQDLVVVQSEANSYTFKYLRSEPKFRCFYTDVEVKELNGTSVKPIRILVDSDVGRFKELVDKLYSSAFHERDPESKRMKWGLYWRVKRTFADVGYNYSLTAHKAQGSTYRTGIVLEWDINTLSWNAKERERIRYVAVTRPSTNLWTC